MTGEPGEPGEPGDPGDPARAPRVVLITSTRDVPEAVLLERIRRARALPRAARARLAVQLRDPELTGRELYHLGVRLRRATLDAGILLLVNDRLDLARILEADGIHLGRRSVSIADARVFLGPRVFVSVACHSVPEVVRAAGDGADAALLSPIFASPGKGLPLGPEALRAAGEALARAGFDLPIIALGGVDEATAAACFEAGAHGVAAIRGDLFASAVATLAAGVAT
jgi:thiamine-phosphate pyrophosphorylase